MHLTENEILLYLEGKIYGSRKEEIENHLSSCSECTSLLADDYKLLKEIKIIKAPAVNKGYFKKAVELIKNPAKERNIWGKSLIFTTLVVIVFTFTIVFYFSNRSVNNIHSIYRGDNSSNYSFHLSPPDNFVIKSNSIPLSWGNVKNAVEYKLKIFDLSGNIIFNKTLSDTMLDINTSKKLKYGNNYLWEVEAFFPDGRSIKSTVASFKYLNK